MIDPSRANYGVRIVRGSTHPSYVGTLVVNGSLAGAVHVASGAKLGGDGQFGELLLGGTLAPGNSVGTTTISGNATLGANSTLEIEIIPGGTTSGVHNDVVQATGNVTINGGTVLVDAAPGNYVHGATYTFLTGQSITGTFDSIFDNLAFFDAVLIYNPGSAQFRLMANMSDFAAVAATPNQLAVAEYIDLFSHGAPSDLQAVIDAMMPLTNQQVQFGLDQFSGAIYGTLPAAGLQHTSYYTGLLSGTLRSRLIPGVAVSGVAPSVCGVACRHPNSTCTAIAPQIACHPVPQCSPRRVAWMSGYGLGGIAQPDSSSDGFRYGLGGTQLGIEQPISQFWNAGIWTNFAWTTVQGGRLNETAEVQNYHFGGYLVGFNGRAYMIGLGGLGHNDFDLRRDIAAGSIHSTASGNTTGWQAHTYVERGLSLLVGEWNVQPYGGLQYVYLEQNGLTESGAGILSLSVDDVDARSLRTVVGGRIGRMYSSRSGPAFIPELRASWLHELLDTNQTIAARFQDLGSTTFAVRGLDLGRDWAMAGGGFQARMNTFTRLFAGYDVQVNQRQTFHIGSGGIEFLW